MKFFLNLLIHWEIYFLNIEFHFQNSFIADLKCLSAKVSNLFLNTINI